MAERKTLPVVRHILRQVALPAVVAQILRAAAVAQALVLAAVAEPDRRRQIS
jgi:hypothetical protein